MNQLQWTPSSLNVTHRHCRRRHWALTNTCSQKHLDKIDDGSHSIISLEDYARR